VDYENLRAVEGVFTEVARGHVDYGLVPIESSSGGGVAETMDAFGQFHQQLNIYAEVQLELRRCLLSTALPNVCGSRPPTAGVATLPRPSKTNTHPSPASI
jgi:chorismate mutase/prephenate dehydratase